MSDPSQPDPPEKESRFKRALTKGMRTYRSEVASKTFASHNEKHRTCLFFLEITSPKTIYTSSTVTFHGRLRTQLFCMHTIEVRDHCRSVLLCVTDGI